MMRPLMKLVLAAFAVGASGKGKLRKEERDIYRRALCEQRRSMVTAKSAQAQQERLLDAVQTEKKKCGGLPEAADEQIKNEAI